MPDNFGPGQGRVLNVQDRSIDNVVFQHRKPALSSEWNLINQISNQKVQDQIKVSTPSGFVVVEDILQDFPELSSLAGQVLTSESYLENSFKVMSKGKNWAVVNGWPILLEGVNTTTEDNLITLNEPGTQKYDFVFLEVWRKLVSSSDSLYPLGNTHKAPYSDNEIEWAAVGGETTKRVQIQYRVRVQSISSDLNTHSIGFNDVTVRPIGGRPDVDPYRQYISAGSRDISLWVAGSGTDDDKTALNTVDGYVYAVPMFMVSRRELSTQPFDYSHLNRTSIDKQDTLNGKVSDRPDGKIGDVIYRDDIIDLRNKIIMNEDDLSSIMDKSIRRLIKGDLNTSINKAFSENGRSNSASGGSILTKLDQINSDAINDVPDMGQGSSLNGTSFKKRSFVSSEHNTVNNLVELPKNGSGIWEAGTFAIDISAFPSGEIVSIDSHYTREVDVTGVSYAYAEPNNTVNVTIDPTSNLVGTSYNLFIVFEYKTYISNDGTKDIPQLFLEANKGGKLPIAFKSRDIPIRYTNDGSVLDFSTTGNSGDSDIRDFVHNAGADYDTNYDFGHDLVIHRQASSHIVSINLTDGKLNGYSILGAKYVQVIGSDDFVDFSISRSVTPAPFKVDSYTITVSSPIAADAELRIALYTGSKPQETIGDIIPFSSSFKYFADSKHAKGVLDTYETIEVYAEETSTGTYTIDTNDKVIIALGTRARTVSGSTFGTLFAFSPTGSLVTNLTINGQTNINSILPVETPSVGFLPTRISFEATAGLGYLRLPVIVHSYVEASEIPYDVYYKCSPYQGLLNSSDLIKGKIIKRGKAIITSLGSGRVLPEDTPISNVIGRLPSYDIEDNLYNSEDMVFSGYTGPLKETDVSFPIQDLLDTIPNDFVLGSSSKSNSRGKFNLILSESGNPSLIGAEPRLVMDYGHLDSELVDGGLKKVFQFYLIRSADSYVSGDYDVTGRVYLVVVSGETNNDQEANIIDGQSNRDCVDIFELCGRPVIK